MAGHKRIWNLLPCIVLNMMLLTTRELLNEMCSIPTKQIPGLVQIPKHEMGAPAKAWFVWECIVGIKQSDLAGLNSLSFSRLFCIALSLKWSFTVHTNFYCGFACVFYFFIHNLILLYFLAELSLIRGKWTHLNNIQRKLCYFFSLNTFEFAKTAPRQRGHK